LDPRSGERGCQYGLAAPGVGGMAPLVFDEMPHNSSEAVVVLFPEDSDSLVFSELVGLKVAWDEEMQSETHMHEGLLKQLARGGEDLEESASKDAYVEDEASRPDSPSEATAVVKNGGSMEELLPARADSVLEDSLEKEQNAEDQADVSKVEEVAVSKVEEVGTAAENADVIGAGGIFSQVLALESTAEFNGAGSSEAVKQILKELAECFSNGSISREFISSRVGQIIFDESDADEDEDDEGEEKVFGSSDPYLQHDFSPARSNSFSLLKLVVTAYPTEERTGEELEIGLGQKMAIAIIGKLLADSVLSLEQIVWSGLDSVSIYWPEVLLIIGPYGGLVQYKYGEPTKHIPECDGVRILFNSSMRVIHRASVLTTSFVGIGSKILAAFLYDVRDQCARQNKDSVRYGITGLTQWWLKAF
jgi:hypothetical protein